MTRILCALGLHLRWQPVRSRYAVYPVAKVCRSCGTRRRIGDDRGRGELALVVLVLLVVVAVAGGVGSFLSGAVDSVRGPWDVRPCNGTTVCDPSPEPAP